MSSSHARSRQPADIAALSHGSHAGSPGVIAAVGGRAGWRLWSPLAVYGVLAALSWVWLWASAAPSGTYTMLPATAVIMFLPIWIGLLWLLGARFALSLGGRRGPVFGFTWVVGTLGPLAVVWLAGLAHFFEHRMGPLAGLSVLAVDDPEGKMSADEFIFNGVTFFFIMLAVPLLTALALGCIAALRYRPLIGILVALSASSVAFGGLIGWGIIDSRWDGGHQDVTLYAEVGAVVALATVVGWLMFRRAPA